MGSPPPFKFSDQLRTGVCVPRFYGTGTIEEPTQDKRPAPTRTNIKFTGKLRDATHQNEAHTAAIKAGHGVLSLPCGYGKTTVSLAIACTLGYRTMIVVHKQFLADQWRERIKQFCPGATIGVVQQNKKKLTVTLWLQCSSLCHSRNIHLVILIVSVQSSWMKLIIFVRRFSVRVSSRCVLVIYLVCPRHLFAKMV